MVAWEEERWRLKAQSRLGLSLGFRRLEAEYSITVAVGIASALLDEDFLVKPFVEGAPVSLINSQVPQSEGSWSHTLVLEILGGGVYSAYVIPWAGNLINS